MSCIWVRCHCGVCESDRASNGPSQLVFLVRFWSVQRCVFDKKQEVCFEFACHRLEVRLQVCSGDGPLQAEAFPPPCGLQVAYSCFTFIFLSSPLLSSPPKDHTDLGKKAFKACWHATLHQAANKCVRGAWWERGRPQHHFGVPAPIALLCEGSRSLLTGQGRCLTVCTHGTSVI